MTFMKEAHAQGASVLVHCVAGMNRSVTTLAIYMVLNGMAKNLKEALALIKTRRTIARPLARYKNWAEQYLAAVQQGGGGGGKGGRQEEEAVMMEMDGTPSSVRNKKDRAKRKKKQEG